MEQDWCFWARRGDRGNKQQQLRLDSKRIPFVLVDTHLQFAEGSFVDSGLAPSMPLIVIDETVEEFGAKKNLIPNTSYYWIPIKSYRLGPLIRGEIQALGNVVVEEQAGECSPQRGCLPDFRLAGGRLRDHYFKIGFAAEVSRDLEFTPESNRYLRGSSGICAELALQSDEHKSPTACARSIT